MAGWDYVKCEECGERLLYDGDGRLSDLKLTCEHCVKKLKKKIEKLKKHDRRKH